MQRRLLHRALVLLLVSAALASASHADDAAENPFVAGARLPEIVLPSIEDGRPVSTAEFLGRKLALQIFASW